MIKHLISNIIVKYFKNIKNIYINIGLVPKFIKL